MLGKTMESILERIVIQLANSFKQAAHYIKKPTYMKLNIYNENLIAIHMRKNQIVFNKTIFIGFCVLELSKHLTYETYYEKLQPIFSDIILLYTDTDSFLLHIKDSNIYRNMQDNAELFEFSDYPPEHILYNRKNKKVSGKLKDELSGDIMTKNITTIQNVLIVIKYMAVTRRIKKLRA